VREIRTIAVIGAGAPGRSIACATALGGFRTILEDILPQTLRRAEGAIRSSLQEAVQAGAVNREEAETAIGRIEFAASLEDAAREAEMVIEAVPDEFDSKEEIFRLLDRICRPDTLLAATTASLSVSDIAAITERASDIVGMRFDKAQIGVVPAAKTSRETLQAALAVARRIGKHAVVVHETADSAQR
jgi:3-hydroxybutyryl-CoA dehydrogenase